MPALGSGYTFAEFLKRLERSPVAHMSPLYQQHRELFLHRPDMFSKAVMSISWEKGFALLQAAYYTQPIAAETYRAALARMLLHNSYVRQRGIGASVTWRAALSVYSEAVLAHGTSLPTRVTVSTLRLLAPQRQWTAAIGVLKLAQANEQLTRPMLIDAAHTCATEAAWPQALDLLMLAHAEDSQLLSDSIQSLRPPGTDALTLAERKNSLLTSGANDSGGAPTAKQWHVLRVLNDIVAAVPGDVALAHPLCKSYLTHLVSSTVLEPEVKTEMIAKAIVRLTWQTALQLLAVYTEPELTSLKEWEETDRLLESAQRTSLSSSAVEDGEDGANRCCGSVRTAAPIGSSSPLASESEVTTPQWQERLQLLQCSPDTAAAMVAVIVAKMPSSQAAVHLIEATLKGSREHGAATAAGTARHPAVLHAFLRKCAECGESASHRRAAAVLLEQCGSHLSTPPDVLSVLVMKMRAAKEATLLVRVLQEHIVPTHGTVSDAALLALLECVLAYNRALRLCDVRATNAECRGKGSGEPSAVAAADLVEQTEQRCVHWLSALGWALDLQTPAAQERIVVTGTGPSAGAVARTPTRIEPIERPMSSQLLSLLIRICVDAGSPQGALKAMGYARRVSKTELQLSGEVRALLYCMMYDRPYEAEAIVTETERKRGQRAAAPLRELLSLAQNAKVREATIRSSE